MEGMSLKTIERLVKDKKVSIKYDPDYEGEKGIVKSCNQIECEIELTDGRIVRKKYSDLQAMKKISQYDLNEFKVWYKEFYARLELQFKEFKSLPKDGIDVIYKEACSYLSRSAQIDLYEAIKQLINSSLDKPKLNDIFNLCYEFMS